MIGTHRHQYVCSVRAEAEKLYNQALRRGKKKGGKGEDIHGRVVKDSRPTRSVRSKKKKTGNSLPLFRNAERVAISSEPEGTRARAVRMSVSTGESHSQIGGKKAQNVRIIILCWLVGREKRGRKGGKKAGKGVRMVIVKSKQIAKGGGDNVKHELVPSLTTKKKERCHSGGEGKKEKAPFLLLGKSMTHRTTLMPEKRCMSRHLQEHWLGGKRKIWNGRTEQRKNLLHRKFRPQSRVKLGSLGCSVPVRKEVERGMKLESQRGGEERTHDERRKKKGSGLLLIGIGEKTGMFYSATTHPKREAVG